MYMPGLSCATLTFFIIAGGSWCGRQPQLKWRDYAQEKEHANPRFSSQHIRKGHGDQPQSHFTAKNAKTLQMSGTSRPAIFPTRWISIYCVDLFREFRVFRGQEKVLRLLWRRCTRPD
jgi:hypothetical protein